MSEIELRGGGNASRQINGILPPGFNCHRIVAVEVYTPSGNWSSYPPHKHDVHVARRGRAICWKPTSRRSTSTRSIIPGGYAYQRVYNDDRSIDGVMMAQNHDSVLVPEGYHPVVSAHGYTTYYLNFLAGSAQSLANSDDPAYSPGCRGRGPSLIRACPLCTTAWRGRSMIVMRKSAPLF